MLFRSLSFSRHLFGVHTFHFRYPNKKLPFQETLCSEQAGGIPLAPTRVSGQLRTECPSGHSLVARSISPFSSLQKQNVGYTDVLFVEQVGGIEPPSLPWQGSIIAIIRYLHVLFFCF